MNLSDLHFAHPLWLWGSLAIPLMWIFFFLHDQKHDSLRQLEKFIDKHLLPYLLVNSSDKGKSIWKTMFLWSIVWFCLTLALAGPRWNFRELETFSRDQSLVILLDLSESMNATDIKPSRLIRAKQKIEDLLNLSKGVKIGLIAFAADPHMIAPITDDKETIRHLLPSLETDLVYVQGSRLSSALDMTLTMLEGEPGNNKALLVISDGGFEDASAMTTVKKLAGRGIVIHTMGIGTAEGAPLRDHEGNIIKKNGTSILSKLEKEILNAISKVGNGHYLEAHYSDHAETMILNELEKRADAQMNLGKKNQLWEEGFYLFILPTLPVILWWFRRRYLFAVFLILFTSAFKLEAMNMNHYFKNSEELGKQALDHGDYDAAIDSFQDSYRKGVAYYKAGNFAEAEKMFRQSSRENVASQAAYNLGNALVQQQKFKEAIVAYEDVLKRWSDHIKAKENLELVKQMLEQQKQENSQSENSDQQEEKKPNESENNVKNQDSKDKTESEKENQLERQDSKSDNESQKEDHDERQDSQENNTESQDSKDNQQQPQENEQQGMEERPQKEEREAKVLKSQEDHDADLWLNRIANDPKTFLKNKFYIESKRNGTKEGIDPW